MALVHTVRDSFDDNSFNTSIWSRSSGTEVLEQNQQLEARVSTAAKWFRTVNPYDLTSSSLTFKLVSWSGSLPATVGLQIQNANPGLTAQNQLAFDFPTGGTTFRWKYFVGTTFTYGSNTSIGTYQWFRIRESGGTTYWDASSDGKTWTNINSVSNPITVTSMYIFGYCGSIFVPANNSLFIDNVNVPTEETKTHTVDSLKHTSPTKTHTVDALKHKTFTPFHTVDSLLRKAQTVSHSVDTLLRSSNTRTHTVDSILRSEYILSHSVDSLLRSEQTVDHTVDSLLHTEQETTHTVDSYLKDAAVITIDHTVDSYLRRVNTGNVIGLLIALTYTVIVPYDITHTVDALLHTEESADHTIDSYLRGQYESTHTVDSYLRGQYTVDHTLDTVLRGQYIANHTVDALKRAEHTASHTVDSYLRGQYTSSHTIDASLKVRLTVDHTVDALLRIQVTTSHTVDASLRFGDIEEAYGGVENPVLVPNIIDDPTNVGAETDNLTFSIESEKATAVIEIEKPRGFTEGDADNEAIHDPSTTIMEDTVTLMEDSDALMGSQLNLDDKPRIAETVASELVIVENITDKPIGDQDVPGQYPDVYSVRPEPDIRPEQPHS